MMASLFFALAAFGVAVWIAIRTLADYKSGAAHFDYWWTYPKLHAERSRDTMKFWCILCGNMLIVLLLGYTSIAMVLSA